MAQRISSTPCDASGCEATEEAPLLDVESVPEERATASPADDGGVETTEWLSCRRFFQVTNHEAPPKIVASRDAFDVLPETEFARCN